MMQFQAALVYAIRENNVSEQELCEKTGSNPRWITEITTNSEWHPRLDTILRLCYSLEFDVFKFLDYAEFGISRKNSSSNMRFPKNVSILKLWEPIDIQRRMILEIMPIHVAKTFRSLRKDCGLSQKNLEEITPFTKSTISLREGHRNNNYPTVTTLALYCKAYKISFSEFLTRVFEHTINTPSILLTS
nr:helix-turn-helix transcriptional regulator [uncultured Sphaerochaeta sp.]